MARALWMLPLIKGDLLAFSERGLMAAYSLATPTAPQRIGLNQFQFGSRFLSNTTAYVASDIYNYDSSYNINSQMGEFYVYNITNPALPKLDSQLVQNFFQQGKGADTSAEVRRNRVQQSDRHRPRDYRHWLEHQWTSLVDHD